MSVSSLSSVAICAGTGCGSRMAVDADLGTPQDHVALAHGAEPGCHLLRCPIGGRDAADERAPSEPAVGEGARAACGLRGVAAAVAMGGEAPDDFGLRPPLGFPQPAVADPVPGRLVLDHPVAIAAQAPMAEEHRHAPPGVL